jgi:hypothetical protein
MQGMLQGSGRQCIYASMSFKVHTRVHGTSRGMYRTAFIFGNPLKITKLIETAGLMWAPDVPPHTVKAKITPPANPRPTWSTAGKKNPRQGSSSLRYQRDKQDVLGWLTMFPTTQFTCDPTPINKVSVPFQHTSCKELTSIHKEEHSQLDSRLAVGRRLCS